jgi:Asp-tRNA(Asn)/Glu-tRNA(Gln) amidotransferase B subunit
MNPIIALLKENNISDEQIKEVFEALTQNPLLAMATISELGLPQEKLQLLVGQVMQNPKLIEDAVNELGLDFSKVEEAKAKLNQSQP